MRNLILVGLALVLTSLISWAAWARFSAITPNMTCPDRTSGETEQDCPWAAIARRLQNLARDLKELSATLENQAPGLVKQLRADAKRTQMKDLWGTSINYDENAKGTIVHHGILTALAEFMQVKLPPSETRLAHAGMEHTYGYLFSTLKTPFGFKRARWVSGDIESGVGLPAGLLGPEPREGSLLLNITAFAGRYAFQSDASELAVLEQLAQDVPKAIREFKLNSLQVQRLEEKLEVPNNNGKIRTVRLRTDFLEFKHVQPDGNSHLLIYSVRDPFSHEAQLITTFPVKASFVAHALAADGLGENKRVTTRYNCFVEGLTGKTLTGERKVIPWRNTHD